MLKRLRGRLTYANVTATLALFIALGGSSYAAIVVTGKNVRNNSLTYRDLKRNTLGGTRVKESRLGTVPRANRLGGKTAAQLTVRCPQKTIPFMAGCIELVPRAAQVYDTAAVACEGAGRRLPTHQELSKAIGDAGIQLAPGGELTANVYPSADPDSLNVLVATNGTGSYEVVADRAGGERGFRCVAAPGN